MILEGLVTTVAPDGSMHLAAMGPQVDDDFAPGPAGAGGDAPPRRLLLRPFPSSQTAANLARVPAGVFHVGDDALLLARVVTGALEPPPPARPADRVPGWRLDDCCRAYEFEVESVDAGEARLRLAARVVAVHEGRPFRGLNRAVHAVVEGAILVTRLHLLGRDEVARRLCDLAVLVEKTGGDREREAFALLEARVAAGSRAVDDGGGDGATVHH
jgi:hypothetical protein